MKNHMKLLSLFLSILVLFSMFLSSFAVSAEDGSSEPSSAEADSGENGSGIPEGGVDYYDYSLFDQIMDLYLQEHLYEFSKAELMEAFIKKLVSDNPMLFRVFIKELLTTMDQYSNYYDKNSGFLEAKTSGFGFMMNYVGGDEAKEKGIARGTYLKEIIKGSNAEKAGLKAGDRLVAIEDINVENVTYDAAYYVLRQFPKTDILVDENGNKTVPRKDVRFAVSRPREDGSGYDVLTFHIERGPFDEREVFLQVNPETSTATITISGFISENLVEEFEKLLISAKEQGCTKLLLDLRNNPGGSLDTALSMADLLIPEANKLLFYINSRNLKEPFPYYSDEKYYIFEKVAVLADRTTVSSAELFTMILQSAGVAKVIGTKTYGKGVGQSVFNLTNGDYFTITSFEILRPDKTSYNEIGLTPDIDIPLVEVKYDFPKLEYFNHQNYADIRPGETNDVVLAYEKRLQIMGIMNPEDVDGYCDDTTTEATKIFQFMYGFEMTGEVSFDMVTRITQAINNYKNYYYYVDSTYEVGSLYLENESRAKRRAKEWLNIAKDTAEEKAKTEQAIKDQIAAEAAQAGKQP